MQVLVSQVLVPVVVKIHDLIYRYLIGNRTNQRVDLVRALLVGGDLPQVAQLETRSERLLSCRRAYRFALSIRCLSTLRVSITLPAVYIPSYPRGAAESAMSSCSPLPRSRFGCHL